MYDLFEFQNIPERYPGKESQQEINPAGFQHMGDMSRIFESELIDQDEEGGERGDEYDPSAPCSASPSYSPSTFGMRTVDV